MHRTTVSLLLTATLAAGCRNHDADPDTGDVKVQVGRGASAAAAPMAALGAGDVRIFTRDSAVDLALIGDTISSGLSPTILAKIKKQTDSNAVLGNGFGASIDKMVKGAVQSAIGTRASFPLSAIRDVKYENGRLEFAWTGKPENIFSHANVDKHPLLESFSPEESQRFVDAVRARKKSAQNM
ncbi:MAG: hypothetical protein ABJE47_11980 [bacterium]